MTEQVVGVPPVEEQVESVTQQLTPPVSDDLTALRTKLELVQRDNAAKGEANRKLNERLGELEKSLRDNEAQLKSTTQQSLANNGEYKQLWDDAKAENARLVQRISELEAQLSAKEAAVEQERLRATAIQQMSASGALAPEQLFGLLSPQIRDSAGTPAVVVNGIEQPLTTYLSTLKAAGSGWDHHFAATTARGMGASASASNASGGVTNPFKRETLNITEALRMEVENPELARALKAEAGRG